MSRLIHDAKQHGELPSSNANDGDAPTAGRRMIWPERTFSPVEADQVVDEVVGVTRVAGSCQERQTSVSYVRPLFAV